jgi:zinc protease
MLFKGGGRLAKGDVHNLVSAEGGRNNAFTDKDLTVYFETLPKERLDLGLFIESERMTKAAFDPAEVSTERQVIISEREGSENYPAYLVREELYASAYHVHPYRWPVVGWKSDLKAMTRDDLYCHYRRYYLPSNAILVVTGNFEKRQAVEKIKERFSSTKNGEKPSGDVHSPEPEQNGERFSKIVLPGTMDYLSAGYHVPETTHADTPALLVLSTVLGGWHGLIGLFGDRFVPKTNRLHRKLVDGKIASEVNTYFPVGIDPGLFYFELTLLPDTKIDEGKAALYSELDRSKDVAPSESELKVAFNQIRSWHAYENDGVGLQALSLGFMQLIKDRNLADMLIDQCLAVTPEEVQRVAKRYLVETNRTVCEYNHTN